MKVNLVNTRNIPNGFRYEDKGWPKWAFGYVLGEGDMVFLETPIAWTCLHERAMKYDTANCFPYAGCMTPAFGVYGSQFSRMGVLFFDVDGKPTVFFTRHYTRNGGVGHDEVSEVKVA